MITVADVSKSFRLSREQRREQRRTPAEGVNAVENVSMVCRPGRVFSLLGPNGAGKTTMLRMIATLLKPCSGAISVAGYDTVREARQVRGRIGFLSGSTGLYERLTPTEILDYYGELHGMDRHALRKRRDGIFDVLGIHEFANRRIARLSSGMKQKVSIARTIIHDPMVMVFDEPTVGLDVITAKSIIDLIRGCRDQGKTVIFSTHIMGEVSLLSDDLAVIHRGKLLFNDTFERFTARMDSRSVEEEFIRLIAEA